MDNTNGHYCVAYCPTSFTENDGTCAGPTSTILLSYNLNKPSTTIVNETGTSQDQTETWNLVITKVGTSGYPSKNRGIYFDSTNEGYGIFPGFLMHYNWSLHVWVMIESVGTHTIFSKDRNDFTETPSKLNFLRLEVNSDFHLQV
ncbi:MAG: hypothetical protein V2I33_17245 [Kangiellaceae bacterium]|jgi:hypothetical protein|nr:hypothetical protein [Kangiellaceae bacterium]